MKKIISILIAATFIHAGFAQNVSLRAVQENYNPADPDGAGPATGSVTLRFEISATAPLQSIAFAVGFLFQSSQLMPSGQPVTATGALPPTWPIAANLPGNDLGSNPVLYGGQPYDRRVIIAFNQGATGLTTNINSANTWTPVCQVVYWTKGASYPQGGNFVIEPGTTLPQHSLVLSDGETELFFESPTFPVANPLGGTLPVLFSQFDAKCSNNGTLISWTTSQEVNSDYFEVQRSTDGNIWKTIGRTPAAGNSSVDRRYNQIDLEAGNAMYRIKQVDKDGQAVYTLYERANCQVKNISTVIYPVPATDVLNVVIKSDRAVRTQLMVFEIGGKLVKKLDANVQNGSNNFRISLSGLPSGDYIIRSSDAAVEINKKFSIIK